MQTKIVKPGDLTPKTLLAEDYISSRVPCSPPLTEVMERRTAKYEVVVTVEYEEDELQRVREIELADAVQTCVANHELLANGGDAVVKSWTVRVCGG